MSAFFVYVIESPSAIDFYIDRSESEIIKQAANLNQVPCLVRKAISRQLFEASLTLGLKQAMAEFPNTIPIIHISAHGHADGIAFSDSTGISWSELRDLLVPVNSALNNLLLVCMSCCEGYSGIRMAMQATGNKGPFLAIVGHPGKPTWSETAVGYTTLYHQLSRGANIVDAVHAMCIASGNSNFILNHSDQIQQKYLAYISNINAEKSAQQLPTATTLGQVFPFSSNGQQHRRLG